MRKGTRMLAVWVSIIVVLACAMCAAASESSSQPPAKARAVVEVEEDVYPYVPADNGAGPLWSYGSSCLARIGKKVFVSGTETIADAKPPNNVRWTLFTRNANGWEVVRKAPGRTREPSPLACFADGSLLLSDNPTLTKPDEYNGPARPEILRFPAADAGAEPQLLLPLWDGKPDFTEHSYRSFAADGANNELILFQNVGYTHAEWSFRDGSGTWSAQGKLKWPWGAEYPKPEPIRVCYPTVALKDRAVYFCGVSDIIEPYPQWRQHKKEITGRDWDYDFRRLLFTWSDDITTGVFHDWIEISSRDKTCGWVFPNDLWVGPDGAVHLLWTERAIDERLREKFFPDEKQTTALMYATMRHGKVELKRPIQIGGEGASSEVPGNGRFHVTENGRLYVFYYVGGRTEKGEAVSENRIVEILLDGTQSPISSVPLQHPFTQFYTATWRSGSAPSHVLDVYGGRADAENVMSYARIRLE